jgi:hypothetical protein
MTEKRTHKIKAKSHILSLLGEELIGSDSLAIFELVKNSYDADAENVTVTFIDLNSDNQKIIIEDDGSGMSPKIIEDVWLTIGTDFKRGKNRKESNKYKRVSFGNKGVGRLAVHKLAKEIELETQQMGQMFSNQFKINWAELINSKEFIQELEVEVETVPNLNFNKGQGTRITLNQLTTKKWTQIAFRNLVRKIKNIQNPFKKLDNNFTVEIKCNDSHSAWIEDLAEPSDTLENSLYKFKFKVLKTSNDDEGFAKLIWDYEFKPHDKLEISKKLVKQEIEENYFIGDLYKDIDGFDEDKKPLFKKFLRNKDLDNIGIIEGEFFVYNLNKSILDGYFPGQYNAIKSFVSENKGVRIFRDGMRVYNYGESYDDWLDLDYTKIQRAGDHFGKKVSIGYIELDLKESEKGLVEKTNREGFIENHTFNKFQLLSKNIFSFFEKTALNDKALIDEFIEGTKPIKKVGFGDSIKELEAIAKEKDIERELSPIIKKIDKDYNNMRDVMVNSGMTGLNLGVAFHEVEREIKYISKDLQADKIEVDEIKNRISNLLRILESLSPLLRKNKKTKTSAVDLIEIAKKMNQNRFKYHNVIFSSPPLTNESENFNINGASNLLIGTLSNIIDNSIYWTTAKQDLEGEQFKPAIIVTTDLTTFDSPAIIIADNGLGFHMEPEYLTQPFKSKKDNGIGLGLYFVDLVMKMSGGRLVFPDITDLEIPKVYNGACLALVFPKV